MAVKYVALDLHQASTSISIRDARGRVIRREVVPTSAARILEAIDSAGGTIHVTFEEGTLSQWIYDELVSRVAHVIVSIRDTTVCWPPATRAIASMPTSCRICCGSALFARCTTSEAPWLLFENWSAVTTRWWKTPRA